MTKPSFIRLLVAAGLLATAGFAVFPGPTTRLEIKTAPATAAQEPAPETKGRPRLPEPALTTLPPSPDVLWQKPVESTDLDAFKRWTARYQAAPAGEKAALLTEGVALAVRRRAEMKTLIRQDPEAALAAAVPESVRRTMPADVVSLLEERIDTRGDLEVTATDAPAGENVRSKPGVRLEAVLGDRRLRAFSYGRRDDQPTRWNIPLHGIALDGLMAVSEWPARVMEPVEREDARKQLAEQPVCPSSGLPTEKSATETALNTGGVPQFFCGPAHALDVLHNGAALEAQLPPGPGRSATAVIAASGDSGITVPNDSLTANEAWTTGYKRVGIVRLKFNNVARQNLTVADCSTILTTISDAWNDWSFGKCAISPIGPTGSFVTPLMNLPKAHDQYNENEISGIWQKALTFAAEQGRPANTFDILVLIAGDADIKDDEEPTEVVSWGGIARVGEGLTFMRTSSIDSSVRTGLHEMGHNLGLRHASNIFDTPRPEAAWMDGTFTETGDEYGDRYDTMGRGGQDYNVGFKYRLHWLSKTELPVAGSDGRFIIREHDLEENGAVRGLQVPVYVNGSGVLPWALNVEYRLYDTANPILTGGAQIRLSTPYGSKSWLLDCTPETENNEAYIPQDGNLDSPLPEGRTFSYSTLYGQTVHITNVNADPLSGELEVEVNYGTPPGNHAPVGSITAAPAVVAANQKVFLGAFSSDADGHELAYYWMIPGASYFPNQPFIMHSFPDYGPVTVKCIVSDMHGGVTTLTKVLNISPNQPPVISAVPDQTIYEDTQLPAVQFTVSDPTTPASAITVTATSSDPDIVPAGGIIVKSLGGGTRSVAVTPAPNRYGTVDITLTANDGGLDATEKFKLTIKPVTPGTLLTAGGTYWKYWDSTAAPPAGWQTSAFNDSAWPSGTAGFIVGQGFFTPPGWTLLSSPLNRVTTYYRTQFTPPPSPAGILTLKLLCDDAAVVYLNGTEVWRQNLPAGNIAPATRALLSVEGANESKYTIVPLNTGLLVPGPNFVAVEVHDFGGSRGGGDVSFDASFALLQAPTLGSIANQTIPEDGTLGPMNLTVADSEGASIPVTLTGVSSDESLVRPQYIQFGTAGAFRTLKVKPETNASGTVQITVKASDGSSETWRTFNLTITPVNDAPVIQALPDMGVAHSEMPPSVVVNVDDVDNAPASLAVTATSSNQLVVPNGGLVVVPGTSATTRWLNIAPKPGTFGEATITVQVSDGALTSSRTFLVRVSPALPLSVYNITLVSSGETWRYLAQPLPVDGRGQPIDWTGATVANENLWPQGRSQLGYGGDGEVTGVPVVPYRITTYFRRHFNVQDVSAVSLLKLRLLRDDGAAVYLNGFKVLSSNMLNVSLTPSMPAMADTDGAAEDAWETVDVPASRLVAGDNVIAVEVHQRTMPNLAAPGDLSFDLELHGVPRTPAGEEVLVPPYSLWSYWEWYTFPDASWKTAAYVEKDWKLGFARFGYGTGNESTVINGGPADDRKKCALFRKEFDVADPLLYNALHLHLQRDDGVNVYVNGTRVLINNLDPAATLGDYALSEIPSNGHLTWHHFLLDPAVLLPGRNLIAVEVHQASASGVDLSFDLQLTGELKSAVPQLFLTKNGNEVELAWAAAYDNWLPRASATLQPGSWAPLPQTVLRDGGWLYLTTPFSSPKRFFRLEKP